MTHTDSEVPMLTIALAMLATPFGKLVLCCVVSAMVVDWKQERDDKAI